MEPKNHPIEKENHLNQTIMTSGSMLIFQGVRVLLPLLIFSNTKKLHRKLRQSVKRASEADFTSESLWQKRIPLRWETVSNSKG